MFVTRICWAQGNLLEGYQKGSCPRQKAPNQVSLGVINRICSKLALWLNCLDGSRGAKSLVLFGKAE